MVQKFFKGDLVQVGEMPKYMDHFQGNCKAIVLYTYAEAYGSGTVQKADKLEHKISLTKISFLNSARWEP